MRIFPLLFVWLNIAVIFPAARAASFTNSSSVIQPGQAERILIQPKAGTALLELGQFHARHHIKVLSTFSRMKNLQILELPAGATVAGLVAEYQKSGLVEFAEPDYTGRTFNTYPNDPAYGNSSLWGLNTISAPAAWDMQTSASNVVVAVVDTGVRYTHQDLAANMWANPADGSHGWNAINDDNDPSDQGTHGTMVAGVLGAVGNNGLGVVGVPWHVRIMACACFNSLDEGNVSDAITCLEFARTNGARIINASWGFPPSLALSNTLVSLHDDGIIVVAACGNSTTNVDLSPVYPATCPLDNIVAVASTSMADVLSTFSNYGVTNVALAAPGEQIYSTFPATDSYYYLNTAGGTSFSAAYVSGACALLMAQYPADSYQQTIARLLSSTDPLPSLAGKCRTGGRLDLGKALRTILVSPLPATNSAPFQMVVSGGLNRTCSILATTNLASWLPVSTNSSSTNGTFIFTDSQSAGTLQKFFRAAANP